ncbi:hypothetical protein CERSUDRAFT_116101 [Gelatoporia subvermispora B]|uniref:Uncharacterized protein n=1 Tax=Ceriporiopsis subvermispora (strain B) TaxID=914234 RepID=M2QTC6_CERS8|nr:hypothetical protein CERSUDRAFT_116101 [Gelatoporia subvermispora B]
MAAYGARSMEHGVSALHRCLRRMGTGRSALSICPRRIGSQGESRTMSPSVSHRRSNFCRTRRMETRLFGFAGSTPGVQEPHLLSPDARALPAMRP